MLETKKGHPSWYDGIRNSFITEFSANSRVGMVCRVSHCPPEHLIQSLISYRIPVWFYWGLPPLPPTNHGLAAMYCPLSENQSGPSPLNPQPALQEPKLFKVEPHSRQKPGETWQEYFARRKIQTDQKKARESSPEHSCQVDHERMQAKKPQPGKKGPTVWHWEDKGSYRVRTLMTQEEAGHMWSYYKNAQLKYDSFSNEYDVCTEFGSDDEKDGDEDEGDNNEDWSSDGSLFYPMPPPQALPSLDLMTDNPSSESSALLSPLAQIESCSPLLLTLTSSNVISDASSNLLPTPMKMGPSISQSPSLPQSSDASSNLLPTPMETGPSSLPQSPGQPLSHDPLSSAVEIPDGPSHPFGSSLVREPPLLDQLPDSAVAVPELTTSALDVLDGYSYIPPSHEEISTGNLDDLLYYRLGYIGSSTSPVNWSFTNSFNTWNQVCCAVGGHNLQCPESERLPIMYFLSLLLQSQVPLVDIPTDLWDLASDSLEPLVDVQSFIHIVDTNLGISTPYFLQPRDLHSTHDCSWVVAVNALTALQCLHCSLGPHPVDIASDLVSRGIPFRTFAKFKRPDANVSSPPFTIPTLPIFLFDYKPDLADYVTYEMMRDSFFHAS